MNNFVPIDFHCHGIGRFDFAEPSDLLLDELEKHLRIEGTAAILTLYLPKNNLPDFVRFVGNFAAGRKEGRYKHILGIALEGPVLASFGGTPERGCWMPTLQEWNTLAKLGPLGLVYIVISPNATLPEGEDFPKSICEIVDLLLDHRVVPALGHFGKSADPKTAAQSIKEICERVLTRGEGPLYTDHLYNDMPVNSRYHWRTAEEKADRARVVPAILSQEWTEENILDVLGPVPAMLINYAKKGVLKICLNFDGDHVDLEVCRRTVEFVGADNLMLMTDRIQSEILAGQRLRRNNENTLLYQAKGIVAGGTLSVMRQIGNMLNVGLDPESVLSISHSTAARSLALNTP